MMNPDIKEQWCLALESGLYPQGTDYLNRDGRFCCLGVLCEILRIPATLDDDDDITLYDDSIDSLPQSAIDAAGLEQANPHFTNKDYDDFTLAELNDTGGTFDEIAAIIRACF